MPDAVDVHPSGKDQMESAATGRRIMTREELYQLVWETPLSRLAPTFGLSDVGLRKICVKHSIPTPPLGYWTKIAHGKRVTKPPLPPSQGPSRIRLVAHAGPAMPPAVAAAQEEALAREADQPSITVPDERPARLHPVAAATGKALRTVKADSEGLKQAQPENGVNVSVSAASMGRALRIIDAFVRAAEQRGHILREQSGGVRLVVDGAPVAWRLHEIKDRRPHQPTHRELEDQARLEERRARWPEIYESRNDTKAYPSWDYYPSGRLSMILTDDTRYRWGRDGMIGHWHDRRNKRLEDYLDAAMAALATGAVAIKQRLAEEAEKARLREEALERQRRAQARRERSIKRHEFLLQKADEHARYEKLAAFADFIRRKIYRYSDEPVDRLIDELNTAVTLMAEGFERDVLAEEIIRLQLFADDDLIGDADDVCEQRR